MLTEKESQLVKVYTELQNLQQSFDRLRNTGKSYGKKQIAEEIHKLILQMPYGNLADGEKEMQKIYEKSMRILAAKSESRSIVYVNDLLLRIHDSSD
jgi:hypothetical protein